MVRTLKYQNLQYNLSPIVPAYDRMPQITANYNKYDWHGFDVSLNLDYTRFRVNTILSGQPGFDITSSRSPTATGRRPSRRSAGRSSRPARSSSPS
jgi:LPS-assembly protein